jgi:hypothetical protein
LTAGERDAYGQAVLDDILKLQRAELMRALAPARIKCNCASGTALNDGEAILAAIRQQNAARRRR